MCTQVRHVYTGTPQTPRSLQKCEHRPGNTNKAMHISFISGGLVQRYSNIQFNNAYKVKSILFAQ